jgi:hypothetical protein
VRRFEDRDTLADIAPGRYSDASDLRCERIRNVVAIQVQRCNDIVFFRPHQDLLQEIIGDDILDYDFVARFRVRECKPRSTILFRRTEFLARQFVSPFAESAFRELHDIALVHQRD